MWQQQQQAYMRGLPSQHNQQQTLRSGIIGTDDHAHQHHQQHHQQPHHQHHRVPTSMMDLPVASNPRASRNMAEKQRRDNLNTNISTMATLLPIVAGSSRRMDKISILRLAAAFLRTQYTLGRGSTNFLPRQLNEFDLEQYFVDQLIGSGGFFLVVTASGKIVYVSQQVERHLGHAQNELLGQSLYNFVHSEDHDVLKRNLTPDGMQPAMAPSPVSIGQVSDLTSDNSSNSSEDSTSHRPERIKFFREQRRTFKIRMSQRTISRREHTQYEYVNISGILRLAEACRNTESSGNRGRHREMASTSNDIVFAGIASLPRSITELSIIDANKDEYVTRHLIDGRIIYCDHRVSVVAGYLSEEVSGLSAFAFMHMDDYKWTMVGLRQMYVRAVTCGSSCYRLYTKTGEFIYLRTHGYLEYDKDTQTFESFVCINTLISEEEGIELIKEMKKRFSATSLGNSGIMLDNIDNSSLELDTSQPGKCSLEEPSRLEDAITSLVKDLPFKPEKLKESSLEPMDEQHVKALLISKQLPPASQHALKAGIDIEYGVTPQGKRKQMPNIKKESNEDKHARDGKLINCSRMEQKRISNSENAKLSDRPLSIYEMNSARNRRNNIQDNDMQSNILAICEPNTNHCISRNHSSCLDASQGVNILSTQETIEQQTSANIEDITCNIKVEPDVDMFGYLEKPEPALQYFDDTASDTSTVSPASSDSHNRCSLKRICSDEDLTIPRNKKRPNGAYTLSKSNDGRQSISYVNCSTFVAESGYPAITVEFNRYNEANSQPLVTDAESPNSSLHEVNGVDYQPVSDHPVAPLVITDPERFEDLQNLKDVTLDLDANPDIMMKIFDDLRPATSFERNSNGSKMQPTSDNQTVNDKIRRTYQRLENSMALRESQFDVLARDLENPALRIHRENLSQLQAEHNIQKQMLKNLQQEHYNMQTKVKHNTIM